MLFSMITIDEIPNMEEAARLENNLEARFG